MTVPMLKVAVAVALALAMGCKSTSSQSSGTTSATSPTEPSASQGSQASTGAQRPESGAAGQDPLMKPGPAVKGHAADHVVAGKLGQVSAYALVVQSDQGGVRILEIVPETSIMLNDEDASYADLQEGQPIRASFANVEGHDVAVEIHVYGSGSSAAAGSPGTGSPASPDVSPGTAPDTSASPGSVPSPEPGSVPAPGPGSEPSPAPGAIPGPDSSTMPR
jgi:hypothetical protein